MKTNTVAIRYNERYNGSDKNEVDELPLKRKKKITENGFCQSQS